MVFLDGGCEFFCYVSDIICIWLVNGRFIVFQVEFYEVVLEIQRDCLVFCFFGISLENIYSMMLILIGQKFKDLGIMKNIKENNVFKVV